MDILSFDPNKVFFLDQMVRKYTSRKEYTQLKRVINFLDKNNLTLEKEGLTIKTPSIISWDGKILDLEYLEGLNIEHALRDIQNPKRSYYLSLIKSFIELLKFHGFLWGDFAPRNMILNEEQSILYIMDFERDLRFIPSISNVLFSKYLRNYSREELACFLFSSELTNLLDDYLVIEENVLIPIDTVISRRKKHLLALLFGSKLEYQTSEVRDVEDLLVKLATPIKISEEVIFPMEILDTNPFDYDVYINRVKQLQGTTNERRYAILKSFEETFKPGSFAKR